MAGQAGTFVFPGEAYRARALNVVLNVWVGLLPIAIADSAAKKRNDECCRGTLHR
jgi:hypothetical protein